MLDFPTLIQQGASNAWLFVPSAILLGILHGLEPGHSKTMMAAFIIAVRGTIAQAVLLGLAATLSHTIVVWVVALVGLHFSQQINAEGIEVYFQLVSGIIILLIAGWMLWRTWRETHHYEHDHHHQDEARTIVTPYGSVILSIEEAGSPPLWQVRSDMPTNPDDVELTLTRPDGRVENYKFYRLGPHLKSTEQIPEPHAFEVHLRIRQANEWNTHHLVFDEHDHAHGGLDLGSDFADEHERQHAMDIQKRFANRKVTTGQIVVFGLTGGLIPCPASITVLLICLQLKQFALGAVLVLCFSIGLAITMVGVGAAAALSVGHASKRWSSFGQVAARAPYLSSGLIAVVGLYTMYLGLRGL